MTGLGRVDPNAVRVDAPGRDERRARGRLLRRSFFARPATEVAPELIGALLCGPAGSGRVVEVEAYLGAEDPGSHGYRGPTPRTEIMFGPPGFLYVYFSYGMHWCANVVCGPAGDCSAVLLRAIAPDRGVEAMRANRTRPGRRRPRDRDLTNGPAKLCQALGIDGAHNGVDVCRAGSPVVLRSDQTPRPALAQTTRIGLSRGQDLPWRWHVADHPGLPTPKARG